MKTSALFESGPEERPAPEQESGAARLLGRNLLIAGAYWAVAVVVRWYFSRYQMWPAPLWLSAGVAMSAVFSFGRSAAPGIFLGSLLTNTISFGQPLGWSAIISAGNTLAPILAVAAVRKRAPADDPFARVSGVFYLGAGALLHGMISATIGATTVWLKMPVAISVLPGRWLNWTMSDAGASLLLVPLYLLLRHDPGSWKRMQKHPLEFLTALAALVVTVWYLMAENSGQLAIDAGASFLILLPLLWMAVRFSASVAYPMFVATMTVVMVETLAGYGPYAGVEKGGTFFIFAQMTIGFGVAVLLLGAASEEQRVTEKALRRLNQELESRVEERTAELRESKLKLERAAFHDCLTGLPNRRSLEERFAACRAAALRKDEKVTFLLIDLDRFKEVNDHLGHDVGDLLLVETGRRLASVVREYDLVARLGGDEFAVVLPGMGERADVDSVCERIVQTVTDRVYFNGMKIETSPSIGVALFPDDGNDWQSIYKAADRALYIAKRAGRCRWTWHGSSEEPALSPAN